jgi:hypothetical protein
VASLVLLLSQLVRPQNTNMVFVSTLPSSSLRPLLVLLLLCLLLLLLPQSRNHCQRTESSLCQRLKIKYRSLGFVRPVGLALRTCICMKMETSSFILFSSFLVPPFTLFFFKKKKYFREVTLVLLGN